MITMTRLHRMRGLLMASWMFSNANGEEPLKWYQLTSRTGVYLKVDLEPVDLEPVDREYGVHWDTLNWFKGFSVKNVYLDDKPLGSVGIFSRISVFTVTQGREYGGGGKLLGTGTRKRELSKVGIVPTVNPGSTINAYRFASARLCMPLEAPFCFRVAFGSAYNFPVNGPGWGMDLDADFTSVMEAARAWCGKATEFLQKDLNRRGLEAFWKANPDPFTPFPKSSATLPEDKTQVCFEAKQVSGRQAVFAVRNPTFGRYVFISYDSGRTYKKVDPYLQPMPQDPDAVLLDLEKLPANLGTPEDVKAIRVLVAGTRKWSVHAKVYVWGQGWEKVEPPAPEPIKPAEPKPLKTPVPDLTGLRGEGHGMRIEPALPAPKKDPKKDPKPVTNPDCW